MTLPDDPWLREAFARLRRADRAGAPSLTAVLAARPGPGRRARLTALAWAGAAVTVALLAAAGQRAGQEWSAARSAAQIAQVLGPFGEVPWRSPTDGLLRTPGYALLVATPTITIADSLMKSVP